MSRTHSRSVLAALLSASAAAAAFAGAPTVDRSPFDVSQGPAGAEALRSWDVVNIGDGFWNVAGNWDPASVPALGDDIRLYQSDASDREVTYASPAGTTLNSFRVDANGNGLMTLTQPADRLTTNEYVLGVFNGKAKHNLNGGTLVTGEHYVGAIGQGTFNMTGGRLTNSLFVSVGNNVGATGTFLMSGGNFVGTEFDVGYFGNGTMIQSGGSVSLSQFYGVGYVAGGVGTYLMVNGSVLSPDGYVGLYGTGTFIQVGGTNTHLSVLSLGETTGAAGTYRLGAGTLNASEVTVGNEGSGTFDMLGGRLNAVNFFAGSSANSIGNGTFANGLVTISNEATFGVGTNSTSRFALNSGTVNVGGDMSLGFEQGSYGKFIMDGGALSSNELKVGYIGDGEFVQLLNVNTVNTYVSIADQAASTGTYAMRGGTLNATELEVGYRGQGTMIHTGGTVNVSDFMAVGFVLTGSGNYNLLPGGVLNAPSSYVGLYGAGTMSQSGGAHNVPNILSVGENTAATGWYDLGGDGVITTGELDVGFQGTGVFNQTGGTITATEINVGGSIGGVGTYTMTGGTINVGDENVSFMTTTSGRFTQSGGVHNVTNVLNLAVQAGTDAAFRFEGGSLNAASVNIGGGSLTAGGAASFVQGGGVMQVANRVKVWGGNSLELNGGSFSAGTLTTNGNGSVSLGSGSGVTPRVRGLEAVSGEIDINDNAMIVDYTGASSLGNPQAFGTVANLIANGWNNGQWDGLGINTSMGSTSVFAIGYAEASQKFGISGAGTASFRGQTVDATSAILLFTYYGDTDLDRDVDISDFATLASNFNMPNKLWKDGDVNYSGTVEIGDFALLAANWNQAFPASLPRSAVPEPAAFGFLSLAGVGLLRRRRV